MVTEVVIPTRNGASRLPRVLEALRRQTEPVGVCVVDNGSTDGTAAVLRGHPEVRAERLAVNRGFGAAVNHGVAASEAEAIVLLNDDAVPDERFVAEILEAQRASGAEMVAGCLRAPDGTVESLGIEIDQSLIAYDYLHGAAYDGLRRRTVAPPLAPSGGAALYVRRALIGAGGFDEAIFAYLEDAELGLRMRALGHRCAVAPRAFAWHEHSATLGARSGAKNALLGWSREYIVWKHGEAIGRRAALRGRAIDLTVVAGKALVDRNLGVGRGMLRARRALRAQRRPKTSSALSEGLIELGLREALSRRAARRRTVSASGRHFARRSP